MDTTHSILRSARAFFFGTAFSRVSGLLRDIATAITFGSSPEIAAFMVSYRLANLFRRLLGEGNLQAGFVPHFSSLKEESAFFYRDVFFSMSSLLLLIVALLELFLWGCTYLVGSDWQEIIFLAMLMAPGLFFISLYALNSSLLQCRKKYFLPAVAPVAFNGVWIAAVLFLPGVRWLSLSITLAFAAQWLMTSFEGWRLLSWRQWLKPHLFSPAFRSLLKPLALGVIGIAATQVNSALDTIFARLADLKGPAFLWYAIRIQQFPLALFGISLSGALLPPLSRTQDPLHRQTLLHAALRVSSLLMLLCTFAILALGGPCVNLVYGHGDFTPADVQQTSQCLWAYGLGLTPSVFVLILAASFYAQKNYRIPTLASLFSVLANIALNALFVFVFHWGAISIAIATSLSALLNALLLSKNAFPASFWAFLFKATVAFALPAALTLVIAPLPSRHFTTQIAHLLCLSAVYFSGVAFLAWRLRLTELFELFKRKKVLN